MKNSNDDEEWEMASAMEVHSEVLQYCQDVKDGKVDFLANTRVVLETFKDADPNVYGGLIAMCEEVLKGTWTPEELTDQVSEGILQMYEDDEDDLH